MLTHFFFCQFCCLVDDPVIPSMTGSLDPKFKRTGRISVYVCAYGWVFVPVRVCAMFQAARSMEQYDLEWCELALETIPSSKHAIL